MCCLAVSGTGALLVGVVWREGLGSSVAVFIVVFGVDVASQVLELDGSGSPPVSAIEMISLQSSMIMLNTRASPAIADIASISDVEKLTSCRCRHG